MTTYIRHELDPVMQAAIAELQQMILARYPATVFTVGEGSDPEGVYMRAVVDVDDPDEVTELIVDRMIDLQVDDGLQLYVVPVRTPERTAIQRQQHRSRFKAVSG